MAERKLNFIERLYIPEIVKGLIITARHFGHNMLFHTLAALGMAKKSEAMVTISYPEVRKPSPMGARTRHRLTKREDGSPKCVACMLCATICPADCIFIEAGEHPDPNIEKFPTSFDIDMSKCVFCGFCVEACPKDAIRMDTGIVELAYFDRRDMVFDINYLMKEDPVIPHGDAPAEKVIEPVVR